MSLLGREWLRRTAVALIVGVAAGWFTLTDVGAWVHRAGIDYLFELRQRVVGPIHTQDESRVAVVVIDEETYRTGELQGLPQVAWTPQIGKVLSAIAQTDVRAVGFDLVYPTTLEPLIPGYDRPLRQAFARLGRSGRLVLGAVDSSRQPIYPEEGQILAAGGIGNVAILNLVTDARDNVVREHLGFGRDAKGGRVPTLVGELARRAGVEAPERFVINYDTGPDDVPVYSFGDLLSCAAAGRSAFFEEAFRGKIVLVGSALDVEDRRIPAKRFVNAPYDGPTRRCMPLAADARRFGDSVERLTMPGVFIHAAALNTLLLDGARLRFPPPLYTAAGTGISIAAATFAFLNLSPLLGVLLLALGVAAVIAGSLWAMLGGVVLPVATMLLAALLSAAIVYVVRFVEELRARRRTEAEKQRMSERFGRYLAPTIIRQLADDPSALRLGGDRRRVSVFFSDLVGYTSISEALKDRPEQLVELVNGYFSVMVSIIERHGGYVDKFIGDAVMAVWGAPLPQADQEEKAVAAGLACVAALQRFNDEVVVGRHGLPAIGARIGINTGEAIVGNMGSPERLNYTVTGDTVNLASRLEGANKAYGTSIMIGPATADAVGGSFVLRPLDLLAVKGKKIPVRVYEAVGPVGDVAPDALQRITAYNAALALYSARRFDEAEPAFLRLAGEDPVAALYVERCRAYRAAPPAADWDGSFGLTEK